MSEANAPIDIPNRALFKAAEVCDLVKVQPYVLRSWEAEFPDLGVAKQAGAPRVYRRADVEQVIRIKHLLLVEGLTLAGARRRIEDEATPVAPNVAVLDELMGRHARERLTEVKRGLMSILDLLAGRAGLPDFHLSAQGTATGRRAASSPTRSKARGRKEPPARSSSPTRRRRSA